MSRLLKYLLGLWLLFGFCLSGVGQCYNCESQYPTAVQTTTSNTLVNVTTCGWGGDYSVFNVTAGETYTWTTCGGGSWDTQLTLFQGGACGSVIAYNDDVASCGIRSTITWTATFTGQVYLLLSQYNCISNTTCMILQWACLSCTSSGSCPAPAPYPASDPCYQEVIAADPWCCNEEWDMFCDEAYAACSGSGSTPITTCNGNFYDSGGSGGNYANNEFTEITICPDSPDICTSVTFSTFVLEDGWDYLSVYDGNSTGSPLLGDYTGNILAGQTIIANNASGCLTFVFDSDASISYSGWSATINCVDCGTLPPAPPQDCNGASTICSNENFNGNSSGPGIQELTSTNQGCLSTENQSSWFFFSPQSTGTIGFMLTPTPLQDYDFAVWGPYDTPTCPPPGPPLRCSWAAPTVPTGLQSGAGDNSEGAGGDGIVNPITIGPAQVGKVYIIMIDNWSASSTPYDFTWNLGGGMSLDCTPLPVDMLSFDGFKIGNKNKLHWSTATEVNADFYQILRSSDGIDYQPIGHVQAVGNTSDFSDYSYLDEHPSLQSYYILKQVDFNGNTRSYGPVAIGRQSTDITVSPPYPNPVMDGNTQLDIVLPYDETIALNLIDLTGRQIAQSSHRLTRGMHQIPVDFAQLAPGVYELRLYDSQKQLIHSSRLIK